MFAVAVTLWFVAAALAYCITKATYTICCSSKWDKAGRLFTIILSLLLGPVFLLISLELMIFAEMGKGLSQDKHTTLNIK